MLSEYKKLRQDYLLTERRKTIGQWLLDHPKQTIREMAKEFGVSKSTVHRDLHELEHIDNETYVRCIKILHKHVGGSYG